MSIVTQSASTPIATLDAFSATAEPTVTVATSAAAGKPAFGIQPSGIQPSGIQPSAISPLSQDAAGDPFWADDPSVLLQKDRLVEFFPTGDQTLPERMNAISRLIIYISVILAVYQERATAVHFGILLMAMLYIMYKNQTIVKLARGDVSLADAATAPLETFADSSGEVCRMPTLQNPFMNHLLGDVPGQMAACKGPGIQEMASNMLDRQLFSDVDDLYNRNSNARLFRTMPETRGTPDRERYANWLVKGDGGCKTSGNCAPFQDLRHQRQLIPEDLDKDFHVTGFNL